MSKVKDKAAIRLRKRSRKLESASLGERGLSHFIVWRIGERFDLGHCDFP
jgi:hypothetical protein